MIFKTIFIALHWLSFLAIGMAGFVGVQERQPILVVVSLGAGVIAFYFLFMHMFGEGWLIRYLRNRYVR